MQFFSELVTVLSNTAKADKIILMGDFNAMVGRYCELWGNTIGKRGGLVKLITTVTSSSIYVRNTNWLIVIIIT